MKILLDYLWMPFFFGAYVWGGIYAATVALMASLVAMVLLWWLWKRELNRIYLFTAVLACVLGGITLYLRDPEFIKLKPTIVYAAFAVGLLGSHWIGERVLLARLPQKVIALPDPVWRRVNFAWGLFFIACALLNLYVARHFSEATWVKLKLFGFTALTMLFAVAHVPFLGKYLADDATRA
ncbi:MAG TPA: inner membrane-spanning protein YciB [Candidatus Binatia bacterium]|nr:inner membrane-spanning protein YciB [Candidatus Binatia bacterium]